MNFIKQHKYMLILTIIGILISPLIYLIYINSINLTSFDIVSFNQEISDKENFRKLSWTKSQNALKYQVVIYDNNLKILKVIDTVNNNIYLDDVKASNNEKIFVNINAIDTVKNKKSAETKNYPIEWKLPSIDIKDNQEINNNKDLVANISFDEKLSGYYFDLVKNYTIIYRHEVIDKKINIPEKELSTLKGKYELRLCKNESGTKQIISKRTINITVPKISKIDMIFPKENSEIPWDDFRIEFTGGENAVNYYITIIDSNNKKIINNVKVKDKKLDVLIERLREDKNYTLEIRATNPLDKNVEIIKEVKFKTLKKSQVQKVESDTPNGNVTWGKIIKLTSQTKDAKIYYTTDGSEPTINSTLYEEPIKINSRVIIKAIAIRKNMLNSEIVEFKYSPIAYGMGSSNSWAPIALYNEGYMPIRYYNQRTGGYSYNIYGPANNDWDEGFPATIASHGCGPTALAIVVSTLTEKDVNPATITDWACKNGYCSPTGTAGGIMITYPQKYGLKVENVTKNDTEKIRSALKSERALVIASVGKGTFTSTAHYIVLRGIDNNDKVLVADPNSIEKSKQFYDLNLILNEAKEPYFYIISK